MSSQCGEIRPKFTLRRRPTRAVYGFCTLLSRSVKGRAPGHEPGSLRWSVPCTVPRIAGHAGYGRTHGAACGRPSPSCPWRSGFSIIVPSSGTVAPASSFWDARADPLRLPRHGAEQAVGRQARRRSLTEGETFVQNAPRAGGPPRLISNCGGWGRRDGPGGRGLTLPTSAARTRVGSARPSRDR